MIRVTITPRQHVNTFALLMKKERELRRRKQGTLHKCGPKKPGQVKWAHKSYAGWIRLQRCIGGVTVALVQTKAAAGENLLLSSFIGFLDRHFADEISSVTITYESGP